MKQTLSRNIALTFRVDAKERDLITERMEMAGISTLRTFLLKMALTGRIINVEMDSITECNRLLRNISSNINQIAKRVNETGNIYEADINDIKTGQENIMQQQDKIIKLLIEVVEGT
ncbi:MAG: plasmid mobilization relaxosome protein MobC [Oscillospiraceae bacterium]|nr:plasmid mobilization relaxosome protein MobC [Oscillospiraceae bacterium]